MTKNFLEELELFATSLTNFYASSGRSLPWRDEVSPYRTWISEIMLQQTRVDVVIPYFLRFMEALPRVEDLAQASEDELHLLWQGLGYYRRIRHAKEAANEVVASYDGELPSGYEALRSLPGIGDYTASAILSIAYHKPYAAMDGNLLRIFSRLFAEEGDITKPKTVRLLKQHAEAPLPFIDPAIYNQALMDLGATVCTPKSPSCDECPVQEFCAAYEKGEVEKFPVKAKKKPPRVEKKTVLILSRDGQIALHKRPEEGLLGGLWEPILLDGHLSEEDLDAFLFGMGLEKTSVLPLPSTRHVFSHIRWEMVGLLLQVKSAGLVAEEDITWVDPRNLSSYPMASAVSFYRTWMEATL